MAPKNFKAPTIKQALSQISRELGPDAIIISHKEIQGPKGNLWVEVTASPREEGAVPERMPLTEEERTRKFSSKKLFILALVVVAIAAIAVLAWQFLPRTTTVDPPSPTLSVAVISFENQTGDNSYDYLNKVIPNLLITSLEQSGYFYVTSWERLHDLLKQMGKEDLEVIDSDLGFEICQMDDIDAIVMGSFAKAGDVFVTDVKVLDVETKRILKSASSKGKGEKSVIQSQIDELSKEISRGIGIPERRIEGNPMRIADVSTDSLDAYYYFVRGKECQANQNSKDARKFFEKAVELDPRFAMAYLNLAGSLRNLGEMESGYAALKKAKKFSARATEKERLYIEGAYARLIERDFEKAFSILKKMVKKYPKEKSSHYGLANVYWYKGLFNLALEEYNKALELDPYDGKTIHAIAVTYLRLRNYEKTIEYLKNYLSISPGNVTALLLIAEAYFEMGKLDEALAKYKETLEIDPNHSVDWVISYIHAFKEDYPEAMRWIDLCINVAPPAQKGWGHSVKSFYLYWVGSLDESMINLQRLIDSAEKIGKTQWKAYPYWMMGWISLDRGEFELSRKHFKSWFDIYVQDILPERPDSAARKKLWTAWYCFYLGLVDLKQGKIESVKSKLVEIRFLLPDVLPEYKDWIKFYYGFLQAEVSLAEGAIDKAISICEKLPPLVGVATGYLVLHNVPFLKDVLARAYIQNGEIEKAIAEYERLVVFDPQREERYLIHPKYYYRLAELYEQKGLKSKATEHYEKFLSLWRDADNDIPEFIEAKKRLSELQSLP
jgi:tetratricopeptide (TPR) repeat protein